MVTLNRTFTSLNHIVHTSLFHLSVICLITILAYSNIFPNQFIGDDQDFILKWPSIENLTNIPKFFAGDVPPRHEGTYRPVRGVLYALVYQVSGQHPFGYHLFALATHLIAVIGVYHLTTQLTLEFRPHKVAYVSEKSKLKGDKHRLQVLRFFEGVTHKNVAALETFWERSLPARLWRGRTLEVVKTRLVDRETQLTKTRYLPSLTALFFGIHPIHTEAVTFITVAFDTPGLAALFWSVFAFIKYQHTHRLPWKFLSLSTAIIAILTNEISLVIPLLLFSYLFLYQRHPLTHQLTQIKPYLQLAATYIFIRFIVLHIVSRGHFAGDHWYYGYLISLKSFLWYLYLLVWPAHLSFIHRLPGGFLTYNYHDQTVAIAQQQTFWHWSIILSLCLITSLVIIAWKLRRTQPLLTFAITWFFIALLPVMNIIPTSVSFSERYVYAASYGFCLALAWICLHLYQYLPPHLHRFQHSLTLILIIIITSAYTTRTYIRNFEWRDAQIYWEHIVADYPDHLAAQLNLAQTYQVNGMPDLAITHYQLILQLKPDYATSYHRIGQIHQYYGDFPSALAAYEQALAIDPNLGETKYDKAQTHYYFAQKLITTNQIALALDHLYQAVTLYPAYTEAIQQLQTLCTQHPTDCPQSN